MRKIWITFASLILISASSHAAPQRNNPLLKFIASIAGAKEFALYTVMENRCNRYLKGAEKRLCRDAVDKQITILDFDLLLGPDNLTPVKVDQAFVFVAFRKNLIQLLSAPTTEAYLANIQQSLTGYLVGESKKLPNLWEISLKHFKTEEKAARAIAALFQDISEARLHLAYLNMSRTQGNAAFESNKELTNMVIDTINMVLDRREENFGALFYPEAVSAKLNRTIYHFYVPLYLSMALEKSGVSKQMAFTAPLIMTLSYEFITAAPDYSFLLKDPTRLDANTSLDQYKLKDIFGSYQGGSFGTKRATKPFEIIRAGFHRSSHEGVSLLLKL